MVKATHPTLGQARLSGHPGGNEPAMLQRMSATAPAGRDGPGLAVEAQSLARSSMMTCGFASPA